MALLQDYGLIFDAVLCVLLVTVIGYAVVLNRKLTVLRSARGEMEKLFADFATATGQAEGGLQALKEGSAQASDALSKNVADACRLADEMAFLVKKGHEIADRLEVQISASRKVAPPAPAAAAERAAPERVSPDRVTMETVKPQAPQDPAAEAAARGIAKLAKRKLSGADSELMRALQAIR